MTKLQEYRKDILAEKKKARALSELAGSEKRDFTPDEEEKFNALMARIDALEKASQREEEMGEDDGAEEDKKEKEAEDRSRSLSKPFETRADGTNYGGDGAHKIHVKGADHNRYSILRALQSAVNGKPVKGVEGEYSKDIELRMGKSPKGFYMPLGNESEYGFNTRDSTTSTFAGSVFISPQMPYIEYLRNVSVCDKMGATFLTGLKDGKLSIPRQNGVNSAVWVAEEGAGTASNATMDQVPLVNQTLLTWSDISRKLLFQSSLDVEKLVMDDLAAVGALELDRAALNGSGTGAVPLGIMQNGAVPSVTMGANGAAATFAAVVAAETSVAAANAERPDANLGYVTSAAGRGTLKSTPKIAATPSFPIYLWENDTINGRKAMYSNQIPSNVTTGSSSTTTSIVYGAFKDMLICTWGGVDVLVNPYTLSTSGTIRINTYLEACTAIRHPLSFYVINGVAQ